MITAKARRHEAKRNDPSFSKAVIFNFASWRLRVGLGFFLVGVLGGSPALAACPGEPHFDRRAVLHFTGEALAPTYNHTLSTEEIQSMRHVRLHSRFQHNPGLTLAEHQLKTDYQIGGITHGRSRGVCVWVQDLRVFFGFTRMDVFLTSQYAEGTCPYRIVLWHENQHVAINTRVYKKYRILMERALRSNRSIPMKGNPLSVGSMAQGKALIAGRINGIINPIYERFKRELIVENAKIDTPANYRRTQAKCKDW